MAHFCTSSGTLLTTDWFEPVTNAHLRQVTPIALRDVYAHLCQFFDRHVADRTFRVSVPHNCPSPWPPVLAPLWLACGCDEEEAAKLLGDLYCRYAIARPELWMSFPDAVLEWKPRRYTVWLNAPMTRISGIDREIR